MGTTLSAMTSANGNGVQFQWVLLIEGVETVLTNGPTTGVLTAVGGDWASGGTALSGLQVSGGWSQELRPWDPGVDVGNISFGIMKTDDADTFGTLVHGTGNGFSTKLTAALDSNDTTATVKATATFASSGTIHIGTEAIGYTGKTSTTFTGLTRGKFAPFKANTETNQRRGQPHRLASVGDGVTLQPTVSSKPREWRGRWVGLWAHRVVAGTLDARAEAQLVWAGRINSVRDAGNGMTYVDCSQALSALKDCELLRDQMTATLAEGLYLEAGWKFRANDKKAGTSKIANDLTVVASSPGTNEILAGQYSLDDLRNALATWLAAEKTAARLNFDWAWQPDHYTPDGYRSRFTWTGGTTSGSNMASFRAPKIVVQFMGMLDETGDSDDGDVAFDDSMKLVRLDWSDRDRARKVSPQEPYRILIRDKVDGNFKIHLENVKGTWFDNRAFIWNPGLVMDAGSEWGVLQLGGGPCAIFKKEDSTTFVGGTSNSHLDTFTGHRWYEGRDTFQRVRYSDTTDVTVKQVALIGGKMRDVFTALLASTGTSGYNHATHDRFPQQLGAGIPWELLGTNFTTDLASLSNSDAQEIVYIDRPTKLMSRIGSDLVARLAQVIWKNQGLRIASWGFSSAVKSQHTFTEANKAITSDALDDQRTVTTESDEFLVNRIRIRYGRRDGDLVNTWIITDPSSQDTYGQFTKEIDLLNDAWVNGNLGVKAVVDQLQGMMPLFSRPMRILRRTIALPFYEDCAPGDFCTVTDNFARNPSTGARGLSLKPGLIIRHSVDWGGWQIDNESVTPPHAEVDILILPLDMISSYSPCAEVDNTAANGGWDAGTKVLTVKAHEHSESSETADGSIWEDASKVVVVEIDPANPASPLSWSNEIVTSSGGTAITLTTAMAGWDSAKRYRMISADYTTSIVEQQAQVYQADDADGRIQDLLNAYVYGSDLSPRKTTIATPDTGTEQVALYASLAFGDGKPLDTGYEKDLARLVNNLVNYRTAVNMPWMVRAVMRDSAFAVGGTTKSILHAGPVMLHPGVIFAGDRPIRVRPWYRSADGSSVTLTVSLCSRPPSGTLLENSDPDAPTYRLNGSVSSATWTTSSTTWGAGAATNLSGKVVDFVNGLAWLVLETNSTKLETRGLCEFRQLAYDVNG